MVVEFEFKCGPWIWQVRPMEAANGIGCRIWHRDTKRLLLQAELLHAVSQGGDRQAEKLRCAAFAADHATRLPQDLFDVRALGVGQRNRCRSARLDRG